MAKLSRRQNLLKKLAALPTEVRSSIRQALAQSADEITDAMQRQAPERSGKLKRSIRQNWGGGKVRYASLSGSAGEAGDPDLSVRISAGDSGVRYAHLVEFGTAPHLNGGIFAGSLHPGTVPRPFFFPVFRAYRRRARSRISRATTKAARKVAQS